MVRLYYRMGLKDTQAQFDHLFRGHPDYENHKAGYCVNAGLEWLVDRMQRMRFRREDIEHLRGQTGQTGNRPSATISWTG